MIDGEKEFGLSDETIQFYRDNGYLHLKGVFSPKEAAYLCDEAHALARRLVESHVEGAVMQGWGSAAKVTDLPRELLHCHNAQYQSAAFTRLIVDPRLTDPMADLIGPNVQLHHTKMFIKPPERGTPFPMHQDWPYFPHENHTMLAAIIHFDDAPEEKGCVRVVPGSHKLGMIEHNPEGGWHLPVDQYPVSSAVALPAKAGDVLIFSYLTIHGSGVNVSHEPRTTILVQMRDPLDRPVQLTHLSRGQGMMLRGIDPSADAGVNPDSVSRYAKSRNGATPR